MNINPMDLIKDIGSLKDRLKEAEDQLKELKATGVCGGGLVKVTLNGRFECIAIELDAIAVDNRDVPMLQTLIKSAHHDAFNKISQLVKEKALDSGIGSHLSSIISGLG